MNKQDYHEFLQAKSIRPVSSGFDVEPDQLSSHLYLFQRDIVRWALKLGKSAIFAAVGLGKTIMQLAWAIQVARKTGKPVLIIAPLAVAQQTVNEGAKFGFNVKYVAHASEMTDDYEIFITNYDRILPVAKTGELRFSDADVFGGVVLDESSILKQHKGMTSGFLISFFKNTPYKLACSATPAPNDHLELGEHAEFLNVMRAVHMTAAWFTQDRSTNEYRLKGNASANFWEWVTSWACCLVNPSDLGEQYHMDGYDLPPLSFNTVVFEPNNEVKNRLKPDGEMFYESPNAVQINSIKRLLIADRLAAALDVIADIRANNPDEPILIWCFLNDESTALRRAIPDAIEVTGGMSNAAKIDGLNGFSSGKYKTLITKPSIAGFGMNWQHCAHVIYFGTNYSYEAIYQTIGRCYRFGQLRPVTAYLLSALGIEDNIETKLLRKRKKFETLQQDMKRAMLINGLFRDNTGANIMPKQDAQIETTDYKLMLGDSIQRIAEVETDSIGLTMTSIPFADVMAYGPAVEDLSNVMSDTEFMEHFDFLISELLRVTMPNRLCAIHVTDLLLYKNRDGVTGLRDFTGMIIRAFQKQGWTYNARFTIWKSPVTEQYRTKRHPLMNKTFETNATATSNGMPDTLLVFRNASDTAINKVTHDLQVGDYIGSDKPTGVSGREYAIAVWAKYASPIWLDIRQGRVLKNAKVKGLGDEKHNTPTQLDVSDRAVQMWTNEGDIVFDPFAGGGSTGWSALQYGRRFVGIELKPEFYDIAAFNLDAATSKQLPMFADEDFIAKGSA